MTTKVKLDNSGLSEVDGEIIALGFLDIEAMRALKVDTYQREFLGNLGHAKGRNTRIAKAIATGVRLPSIVIGVRGQDYSTRGSTMVLNNPTYIIDGLQRVFSLLEFADANPDKAKFLTIGAEVRFDTDFVKEKALFHALNAWRTSVSGNVILRNMRDQNRGVALLYDWTHNHRAILFNRVQWDQRMKRGELIPALTLAAVTASLHTGSFGLGNVDRVANMLESLADTYSVPTVRENLVYFFGILDDCFKLSKIEYRQQATALRGNFMSAVAMVLHNHSNFWRGRDLVVTKDQRRRLARFPIHDPEICRLASAGNMAQPLLVDLLIKHMNKGMKVGRLQLKPIKQAKNGDK